MKKKKPLVIKPCGCSDIYPPHVCIKCYNPEISENKIENPIVEYLEKLPFCQVTKTGTKGRRKKGQWIKAKKSEGVGKGDLTICLYGFYIEIEVKKPGEKRSIGQIEREKLVKKALGEYWLVESVEDTADNILNFKKRKIINQ